MDPSSFLGEELHVRLPSSYVEENVSIFFFTSELHFLNRNPTETIDRMCQRLKSTWTKEGKKKKKKSAEASIETEVKPRLLDELGNQLDADVLTILDLRTGMRVCLGFGSPLLVVVNPPAVTHLTTFPSKAAVAVGQPLQPIVSFEFGDSVDFFWFRETVPNSNEYIVVGAVCCSLNGRLIPNESMVGCKLKVFAVASDSARGRQGRAAVFYVPCVVQESFSTPAVLAYRKDFISFKTTDPVTQLSLSLETLNLSPWLSDRPWTCKSLSMPVKSSLPARCALRVLTYNILAEPFATSESAVKKMFAYCPLKYLESEYRLQLVARELLAYSADVILLQECDAKAFSGSLEGVLGAAGYKGMYSNKVSRVREGCALFVREGPDGAGLRLEFCITVPLGKIISKRQDLQKFLQESKPEVREILVQHLGTVAQLALLSFPGADDSRCLVVVANTHLFYHPGAGYVRLLQTDSICVVGHAMARAAQLWSRGGQRQPFTFDLEEWESWFDSKITTDSVEEEVPLILAGDLNSTPETAVIQYLETGCIESNHDVWNSVYSFQWGSRLSETEEEPDSLGLEPSPESSSMPNHNSSSNGSQPIMPRLVNPHGAMVSAAGYTPFTNYTGQFKDLLDYIYIQSAGGFRVCGVAPFPPESVLEADTALPSGQFPSDHISVVVDLIHFK